MTAFARLESKLPDVCRNLRNARSELHVSATVEVDARAAVASTNVSMSRKPIRLSERLRLRIWSRKRRAVLRSRLRVVPAVPLCAFRYPAYALSSGGSAGGAGFPLHAGTGSPNARNPQAQACIALRGVSV
jgi:hypothetical protein